MPKGRRWGGAVLGALGSGRLALLLVAILILLALAGALLPQEGRAEPSDILRWQEGHAGLSAVARPLGLFRVFHSVPFLVVILLLALNTLTCTVRRLFQPGSRLVWKNFGDIRTLGFLGLHVSLLLLMGGGFHSSATRLDGYLVLTEGQSLKEEAGSYVMLAEGPLRRAGHQGFEISLAGVAAAYDAADRIAESSARLEFRSREGRGRAETAEVNHPVSFLDVAFTLDETGFSPRLAVQKRGAERPLVDSFVALRTFRDGRERDYRDFVALPFLDDRIFIRFLPDAELKEGRPAKIGEKPRNPLLQIWTEGERGEVLEEGLIRPGETAGLLGHDFTFMEFRKWAGFRVVQDSGYAWVLIALWLGLGSLLLRYLPDLKSWFSPRAEGNEASGGNKEHGTT